MKITVLMSCYNGEKYIGQQIDSILAQKLPSGIELSVLIRDDGSSDSTKEILGGYKDLGKIDWYGGENLRPAKSFWQLVKDSPKSDYYAFCDQDDFWQEDKLARALEMLAPFADLDIPLLYCSDVTVTDGNLDPTGTLSSGKVFTDLPHALVYSLAPGCTFVFNERARAEFVKYDMNENFVVMHDWLAHKITAMLGKVVYDSRPSMLYRQHGGNVIGAKKGGLKQFFSRVKRLTSSDACVRSNSARDLLKVYGGELDEEKKEILRTVAFYRDDKKLRKRFKKDGAFSVDKKTDFLLRWLIRLKKV